MARSRMIRPEFLDRSDRATVGRDAQLLYLLMQLNADDEGRLLDSPRAISGAAFAVDDTVTAKKVTTWLDELVEAKWIRRYSVDKGSYILIERWADLQKVQNKTTSSLPAPEGETDPF
jgi:hypothetical protein